MDEPSIYEPQYIYLRYAVIVMKYGTERYIIAVQDAQPDSLFFYQELGTEKKFRFVDTSTLFDRALHKDQAAQILDYIKENKLASARACIRKYFDPSDPVVKNVGMIRLDDAIDDAWYDCWKVMEGIIASGTTAWYDEGKVRVNDGW